MGIFNEFKKEKPVFTGSRFGFGGFGFGIPSSGPAPISVTGGKVETLAVEDGGWTLRFSPVTWNLVVTGGPNEIELILVGGGGGGGTSPVSGSSGGGGGGGGAVFYRPIYYCISRNSSSSCWSIW